MADRKISDLTALTTPATGDLIPIVDISEAAAADKNKSITVGELLRGAPDGTAAAPGIAFESDPNSGIYSPGADQVAISTNGTGRLFVDANGNVGAGTASPRARVDFGSGSGNGVLNQTVSNYQAVFESPQGTGNIARNIAFAVGTNGIGAAINAVDTGGSDATGLIVATGTAGSITERLRIDSTGNVGVGTTSPAAKLNVYTDAGRDFRVDHSSANETKLSNDRALTLQSGGSYALTLTAAGSSSSIRSFTNSVERTRIDSSGRLLVGAPSDSQVTTVLLRGNSSGIANAGTLRIERGQGAGSITSSGIELGTIALGAAGVPSAIVNAESEGNWTPGSSFPTRLVFSTTADGTSSPTERMRIRNNGIIRHLIYDEWMRSDGTTNCGFVGRADQTISGGDTANFGISTGGGDLLFGSGGTTERARIDSSGRLGIGSTSPLTTLECRGQFSISNNAGSYWVLDRDDSDGRLKLLESSTSTNERLAIDSSGRLLVNTSSARSVGLGSVYPATLQVETTAYAAISAVNNSNDVQPAHLCLGKSRGGIGGIAVVQNGDGLGLIRFAGADGTDLESIGAQISAEVDGTPGANDMPGRLVFSTTADGASSPTESFRITNTGRGIFNRIGTPTDTDFVVQVFADSTVGGVAVQTNQTGARTAIRFRNPNGIIGEIITNGSATAYNTSSDYRLKDNVVAVTDGITRLQQLKPSRFNFIADPDKTVDGFIAHEVQAVVPEAINGEKDAVDEDGNPVYQGIDQSKLVPLLTAALQEAIAKIETLEARLTAAGI